MIDCLDGQVRRISWEVWIGFDMFALGLAGMFRLDITLHFLSIESQGWTGRVYY